MTELRDFLKVKAVPCAFSEQEYKDIWDTSDTRGFLESYIEIENEKFRLVSKTKYFVFKNWKKITDWSDLKITVGEDFYYNWYKDIFSQDELRLIEKKNKGEKLSAIQEFTISGIEHAKQHHNPIKSFEEVELDFSDTEFSVKINGKLYRNLEDEAVITLAMFIEKQFNDWLDDRKK